MRGLKTLLGTTALLAGLALAPAAQAQIVINIGVQPVCSYGYYDYAPYACAPMGYYGPGYFYNGIFLGMGPWAGWGYGHGWGSHRFVSDGGGQLSRRSWPRSRRPRSRWAGVTPRPSPNRYSFPFRCGASQRNSCHGACIGSAGAGDARLGNTLLGSAPVGSARFGPKGGGGESHGGDTHK